MFNSLYLKNVLSHKESTLNFHPGVNMIIGPSDQGKSAIFNGFYKVLYNRPSGDEWKRWETKESEIHLDLDDYLIRYEKKSQAKYLLENKETKKEIEFKAFGQNVPEEIQQIVNMDKKINVQQQLERGVPIFLIAESPGDVAKHFNSVAGFDVIDSAISTGKTQIKQTEKEIKTNKGLLSQKQKELKKYTQYLAFEELVQKAEEMQEKVQKQKEAKESIENHLDQILPKRESLKQIQNKLKINIFIKKALVLYNKIKGAEEEKQRIENRVKHVESFGKKMKSIKDRLEIKPSIDRAFVLFKIQDQNEKKKANIKESVFSITKKVKGVQVLREEYKKKKMMFKKEMPEICPVCGK